MFINLRFFPGKISSVSVAGVKIFWRSIGFLTSSCVGLLDELEMTFENFEKDPNPLAPNFFTQVSEKWFFIGIKSISWLETVSWLNNCRRFGPLNGLWNLSSTITVASIHRHHFWSELRWKHKWYEGEKLLTPVRVGKRIVKISRAWKRVTRESEKKISRRINLAFISHRKLSLCMAFYINFCSPVNEKKFFYFRQDFRNFKISTQIKKDFALNEMCDLSHYYSFVDWRKSSNALFWWLPHFSWNFHSILRFTFFLCIKISTWMSNLELFASVCPVFSTRDRRKIFPHKSL